MIFNLKVKPVNMKAYPAVESTQKVDKATYAACYSISNIFCNDFL